MTSEEVTGLVERLREIQDHDWRLSFIAHTSDTAGEAAAALTTLSATIDELRAKLDASEQHARTVRHERGWAQDVDVKAAEDRADSAESRLADEVQIVDRIWGQLGKPTYEELAGRSIYDLIEELKSRSTAAESQLTNLREALSEAEAVMSIVEPRSDKREYLASLDRIRAVLRSRTTGDVDG